MGMEFLPSFPRRHFAENQWWRYKISAVFSRYIVFYLDQTVVFSSRTVSKEFCASWESSSSTSSSHLQVARVKTEPDELLPLEFDLWRAPGASSVKEKPRGPYAELSVGSNSSPVCSTVDSWGIWKNIQYTFLNSKGLFVGILHATS